VIKRDGTMGMTNIADKVVVITGASSGIGESTAKLLAQNGARVVLGAPRKDRIDALTREISASGGKSIGFPVDVTKRADVEAFIRGAVESFGRVDVIVNNAGRSGHIINVASVTGIKCSRPAEWFTAPRSRLYEC
jgi:NADP-dependent 3-hydroxy acid dehydrogenase YdfG